MARNKIVSITKGLEKPEQLRMGSVAGAISVSLGVEAKVDRDAGLLTREPNTLPQPADGHPHSIGFQECAVLPETEKTYWIASDSSVGVLGAAAAMPADALCVFSTFEELTAGTREWPVRVLVKVWNQLPDQPSVARFENRRIALQRLWRAIQKLPEQARGSTPGRPNHGKQKKQIKPRAIAGSKTESMVALLKAPGGATLSALIEATGWQAHTVRGFLSRKVSKQLGLPLQSFRRDGQRTYALPSGNGEDEKDGTKQTAERA